MKNKVCTQCKEVKPIAGFHKNKNMKDGHQPACKLCMNVAYNKSRKKKQEHYQQVSSDRMKRNTDKFREWKSKHGCSFCEETFGPCLQLHHYNDDKEHNVANLAKYSFKKMLEEASKCIVVCGNCHTKIHHKILKID